MKVKDIKSKVAAKIAKGKAKVARKCGKGTKACAIVLMAALCTAMCGCKMGEQPTAQRAQTANTYVYVYEGAPANFGSEFVSLAQANETGGAETMTNAPKNTPTVTTDTASNTVKVSDGSTCVECDAAGNCSDCELK